MHASTHPCLVIHACAHAYAGTPHSYAPPPMHTHTRTRAGDDEQTHVLYLYCVMAFRAAGSTPGARLRTPIHACLPTPRHRVNGGLDHAGRVHSPERRDQAQARYVYKCVCVCVCTLAALVSTPHARVLNMCPDVDPLQVIPRASFLSLLCVCVCVCVRRLARQRPRCTSCVSSQHCVAWS